MKKILIIMFLFSFLVIPLHSSFAIYNLSYLFNNPPKPVHTSWTPLKFVMPDQSHLNPYAPLGSQFNQMYTRRASDFSGWTNSSAPLGSQFNPLYIGNSNYHLNYPGLFNTNPIGTQFNPIYLSPPVGF